MLRSGISVQGVAVTPAASPRTRSLQDEPPSQETRERVDGREIAPVLPFRCLVEPFDLSGARPLEERSHLPWAVDLLQPSHGVQRPDRSELGSAIRLVLIDLQADAQSLAPLRVYALADAPEGEHVETKVARLPKHQILAETRAAKI